MTSLNLEQFVNERPIGRFHINVLLWIFLALVADGYNMTVVAFAAPDIARLRGLDPATLGPVLSASVIGMFFGAPLFGWVGDRWGRRPTVLLSCVVYGLATLALLWTSTLTSMFWWRFAAGVGIGGLLPNAIALMAELIPNRSRAAFIIIAFIGAFVGSAAPSAVMAMATDANRISALWLAGGLAPLLVAAGAAWRLPESLQLLATRPEQRPRLLATIRRLQPGGKLASDLTIDSGRHAGKMEKGLIRQLFSGRLAIATPLLWICFICSLAAIYFLSNWLPLLFVQRGIPTADAAWITALYHIGAGVGSVVISALMDRLGFLLLTGLFFSSIVPIVLIAQPTTSVVFLGWATAAAGFLGQNIQLALNAGAGVIYPTRFRSKAVGAAFAVGRTGAIAGPMLGGMFFGMKLPMLMLFAIPVAPMVVGGVCAAIITAVLYRAQQTFRVSEIVD